MKLFYVILLLILGCTNELTIRDIKKAPWKYEVVEVNIKEIRDIGPAGMKFTAQYCQPKSISYEISDGTEVVYLCALEDIKIEAPMKVNATITARPTCKVIDQFSLTSRIKCLEFFPNTSRNPKQWYFELEYTEGQPLRN